MKRFCEYLFERQQARKNLLEAVNTLQRENNQMLLNRFGDFLDNRVQDKEHTFVKVLKFQNDEIKSYNLRFENNNVFDFQPAENATAYLKYSEEYGDDQEASVELVFNDVVAMRQAAHTDGSEIILRHVNRNANEDFSVYYDDRLNLVFLCIGAQRQQIEQFVNSLIASLQGMIENSNENTHVDGSYDRITQAIQHYENSPVVLAILNAMTSRDILQRNVEQPVQQEVANVDVGDVEPEDVEVAVEQVEQQPQNQQNTQEPEQDEQPQENDGFVEFAGMRIRDVSNENIQSEQALDAQQDVIVSGQDFQDFQQTLNSYGEDAKHAFAGNRQTVFKKIQWDSGVDPLARLSFMRFTMTNTIVEVIFSCRKNSHKFIQKMRLDRATFQSIWTNAPQVWARHFVNFWTRNYSAYAIELLWDPDGMGDSTRTNKPLKHTGTRPNGQQAAQPRQNGQQNQQDGTQQQQGRQRQQRQPRAGVYTPEQITQLTNQVNSTLRASGIGDVDVALVLNRSGRTRGIPRDDNKYFVLKFPGVDPEVLVGEQAQAFLNELGLWTGVIKPAFDQVSQSVENLKLCITMNNRYYVG